jgi:branched-chain amino acid transport system substrate-binding protein
MGGIQMKIVSFGAPSASLALLLLSACATGSAPAEKKQMTGDEIVIGVAGPMSGDLAIFGEQLQHGARQAVADINAAGGVLGKQLHLIEGDDQCDPKRAVGVANKMVGDGAVFVDGHFCSGSSIPASKIYGDEGVLQITPASTNPRLTDDAADEGIKTLFRVTGRDDQQGYFAGPWLARNYAGKKVAVLDDRSAYGRSLADVTETAMEQAGLKPAVRDTYSAGSGDYSTLIAELKAAQIEAIYMGGYHDDIGTFIRQAREQGLNAKLFGADALNTQEFATIAGKASDGTMFTNAGELRNIPFAKRVVEKFRSNGYEPEGYTLSAYAAIEVWAQAANKVGTTEAGAVAAALHAGSWDTVIGKVSFDAKGDLTTANYVWYQFQGGRYSEAGS